MHPQRAFLLLLKGQKQTGGQTPPFQGNSYTPLSFGLFLLPFSKKFGYHHFGAVAWIQRPKIFVLKRHFVTFNGQTETDSHTFYSFCHNIPFGTFIHETNNQFVCECVNPYSTNGIVYLVYSLRKHYPSTKTLNCSSTYTKYITQRHGLMCLLDLLAIIMYFTGNDLNVLSCLQQSQNSLK